MRTGGELLVDALVGHGAELAFGVPGESYLAVLDALHDAADRIRVVTCRHEAGAANMAEAYGKLTGQPGICMVARRTGPGGAGRHRRAAAVSGAPTAVAGRLRLERGVAGRAPGLGGAA